MCVGKKLFGILYTVVSLLVQDTQLSEDPLIELEPEVQESLPPEETGTMLCVNVHGCDIMYCCLLFLFAE